MAKRKARASQARKTASTRAKKTTRQARAKSRGAVNSAKKRVVARKAAKKAKRPARPVARKASKTRAKSPGKAPARKTTARKAAPVAKVKARKASAKKNTRPAATKKIPALNRTRRTVQDDDVVPSPPSSLDLDRSASSARTGRRGMHERMEKLTQTGPALTGGDVDADWESAYSVGDEAPGGDNPTPDQDVVDEIGEALGLQYEDNEELKGESKITERDSHRWELDPASSDDYNDR